MTGTERLNLTLRALMELGVVCGLAYWGYWREGLLLAVGAPAVGFGFWGAVDFHQAGRAAEPLRVIQELVVSGLAAAAIYVAGQHALGWTLASVSVVHPVLIYGTGNTLLKRP
ncbi:MAG: YrdB family protein [Gemmatimonadetes bacterium]|nr:YrdB family protein [Gemmatimonadota bacterium]